jgi:hypothetical protein
MAISNIEPAQCGCQYIDETHYIECEQHAKESRIAIQDWYEARINSIFGTTTSKEGKSGK